MSNLDLEKLFYENVGDKIKVERAKKKMSQQQVSEIANIDFKYLSKLERGIGRASLKVYNDIARALDTTLDYLTREYTDDFYSNYILHKMKDFTEADKKFYMSLADEIVNYSKEKKKEVDG